MVTEEQIKELAYALWEEEGHPEGKDLEHYYRARQILESRDTGPEPIELTPFGYKGGDRPTDEEHACQTPVPARAASKPSNGHKIPEQRRKKW